MSEDQLEVGTLGSTGKNENAIPSYDIITVGGGMGGAALAEPMAERGYRVLVLERETRFKDRVRGELLVPWGVAEAQALGVYDALLSGGAQHPTGWDVRIAGNSIGVRDLAATTPQGLHAMTFFHPQAQEALLSAAAGAGADVRRGARVLGVKPGASPEVTFARAGQAGRTGQTEGGQHETATARLVVGADGRGSMVRKWGGFESKQDPEQQWLAGVLFEDTPAPMDSSLLAFNPFASRLALMLPQGNGRARFYFGARATEQGLQGERDVGRFIEESVTTGMPREFFEGARPAGPLATFAGADCWVEHPYRDGMALIGDAAAQSDQTWGQGVALTLRDARMLCDVLCESEDWDEAGHAYAEEHDRQFEALHTVEGWFTSLLMEPGPEAEARRAKALQQIAVDQDRLHDAFFSGPDYAPVDEAARRRFFGEE